MFDFYLIQMQTLSLGQLLPLAFSSSLTLAWRRMDEIFKTQFKERKKEERKEARKEKKDHMYRVIQRRPVKSVNLMKHSGQDWVQGWSHKPLNVSKWVLFFNTATQKEGLSGVRMALVRLQPIEGKLLGETLKRWRCVGSDSRPLGKCRLTSSKLSVILSGACRIRSIAQTVMLFPCW